MNPKYTRLFGIFLIFGLGSCADDPYAKFDQVPIETEIQRFDQAFFETDSQKILEALPSLQQQFAPFFSNQAEAQFWQRQRTEPLQMDLYAKVQQVFGGMEAWEEPVNRLFKAYYHYFGTADTLKFYTYISRLDFNYPVVFAPPYVFAGLDLYLGKLGQEYYQSLPQYLQYHRQAGFLLRDIAVNMVEAKVGPASPDASLLEAMLHHGKVLYTAHLMLPELKEADLLVYPPEKHLFAQEHEKDMWIYFIENQLLFSSSMELKRQFVEVAPFSKFRSKNDAQTPGRIGQWFGYKIIKAYAEATGITQPKELWQEQDARKILKLSGYKP